mmetsp:Transcript_122560/g.318616  ORF Transcript_122560/g.318616 Transcript_122560/m.318616 type:complete len:1358 (-) Transcript_122560:102-4175(-)
MAHRLVIKITFGLCYGIHGGFVPFANVDELKPKRIEDFCGSETFLGRDGQHVRRCQHHFKKQLEDDGEVELGWKMDVDPGTILSLDTEAEHGVRLTKCEPAELELELPDSHIHHAVVGKLIIGSRFVHNCDHLDGGALLHQISEVRVQNSVGSVVTGNAGGEQGLRRSHVKVGTKELPNLAHAIPSLSFYFSWMPSEAREVVSFPAMRTDYGLNREYLQRQRRQLMGFPSLPDSLKNVDGVDEDAGGFQSGGAATGNFDTKNGVLNLMPKQLSNFGWNWNFFMNTTQEPNFEMDIPGAKGKLKIRKPYIKVHSGIYLNFSSEFTGLTLAPKVQWTAGIKGHGHVQARILGSMNTTADAGTDPFHAFKLPVLQELENPVWFEKVDFATGSLPLSMEPGFQFAAQMYHHGNFHGAIGVGGRTQGTINPSLSYDSLKGFDTAFQGELTDTDLWPPLWMIFTRRFEMGIMLKPSLLMKGNFAGLERATMAIQMRPYANITIKREGASAVSSAEMKTLTVYPMRVMGIEDTDASKKYKVKVNANGQDVETTAQMNWGSVVFRDHISNFDCGELPQKTLMNPAETKIVVTLIQVDDSQGTSQETPVGTGSVTCSSLLNGECQPSPANVVITTSSGNTLATVQMAIIWETDPNPWFASKIRGLGFSFPQVILRQDTLTSAFPNAKAPTPGSNASSIMMHLIHGGQTYIVGLIGTIDNQQSALAGDSMVEFGPAFTDTWLPCQLNTQKCSSPKLELYAGSTLIGAADIPEIEFTSQTAMQGTSTSSFLASSASQAMNVPSTIALNAPGDSTATIALVTMNAKVVTTLQSSIFLSPRAETQVPSGSSEKLSWTVSGVDRSKEYSFTLTALRLTSVTSSNVQAYVNYPKVNNNVLMPVPGSKQTSKQQCQAMATAGMSASEAPCSFSHNFAFEGSGFSNGDQVVVLVQWSSGGTSHQMYSPPFEISSSGRRLSSEPAGPRAAPRRLWTQEAWNARIQQHSKSCNAEDLHFDFGLGMLMRGKVESISVPKGFPMIGGLDEQPELTTGFRRIAAMKPGEDATDAFGGKDGILCQAGLCQGMLPGCSEGSPKQLKFPKLVFDFNRAYHFRNDSKGNFNGLMKQALAYAFSTLPEMVDVVIQTLNESGTLPGSHRTTTTQSTVNWWNNQPATTPAPSVQWPVQRAPAPAPTQAPAQEDSSLTAAFDKWWSGGSDAGTRRLAATVPGDKEDLPTQLGRHQVRLEFKMGVPFIIDRPLVEMMLDHGYFKGLEDVEDDRFKELGPLEITRFYVDSGLGHSPGDDIVGILHRKTTSPASQRTQASASSTARLSVLFATAGGVSVLAVFLMRRQTTATSKQRGYSSELSDEPDGME